MVFRDVQVTGRRMNQLRKALGPVSLEAEAGALCVGGDICGGPQLWGHGHAVLGTCTRLRPSATPSWDLGQAAPSPVQHLALFYTKL